MKSQPEDFAKHLAEILAPLGEIALLKEGKEVEVWNRLTMETPSSIQEGVSIWKGKDRRTFKEAVLDLPSSPFQLRVRLDITLFSSFIASFQSFVQPASKEKSAEADWKEQVEQAVATFFKERNTSPAGATRSEKRELVKRLQKGGFLEYKQASQYVSQMLQLSRASFYNYLKEASTLETIQIHQVDAFTNQKFGGNPAGVVLDGEKLTEQLMRQITREMNLSETAFVFPGEKGDLRLRYFTPSGDEVKFCGHSTVGAMYMLAREKRLEMGPKSLQVETGAGLLKMKAHVDNKERITVEYEAPKIDLRPADVSPETFSNILGIPLSALDTRFPIMWEETNRDLFAVIPSLKVLGSLQFDLRNMERYGKKEGVVAFCLLTPETFDSKNSLHCRCFAPAVGIPEDPFTGSVQGGLAAYAEKFGLLKGKKEFGVEQGHFVNRPGSVRIRLEKKGENYTATVLAQAIHCFSTQMEVCQ